MRTVLLAFARAVDLKAFEYCSISEIFINKSYASHVYDNIGLSLLLAYQAAKTCTGTSL